MTINQYFALQLDPLQPSLHRLDYTQCFQVEGLTDDERRVKVVEWWGKLPAARLCVRHEADLLCADQYLADFVESAVNEKIERDIASGKGVRLSKYLTAA